MNTCDTCKHWGANPQGDNRENAKECACPEILPATTGYGTGGFGNYTGMGTTWQPLGEKQAAIFTDSPASFCPGPKFGCVHWEMDRAAWDAAGKAAEQERKRRAALEPKKPDHFYWGKDAAE